MILFVIFRTETIHDVWQFGIVIFVCLTGCLPWQKAGVGDPRYARYLSWHTSTLNLRHRQPKLFRLVSSRAQRLFRKFLEPKPEKRPSTLSDVHKYLDERWMAKNNPEKTAGKELLIFNFVLESTIFVKIEAIFIKFFKVSFTTWLGNKTELNKP